QSKVVDPPLLERGGAGNHLRVRRPAHLALDFADELLDASGRADRLLALERDQRLLALLIREVDLDRAAGQDRPAHQRDEQDEVLAREPPANHYPGTSGKGR